MADVFHALAYYYDHRDEFVRRECEAETTRRDGERRTRELLDLTGIYSESEVDGIEAALNRSWRGTRAISSGFPTSRSKRTDFSGSD